MKKKITFLCLFLAILSISAQNFVPVANKYYNIVESTSNLVVGTDGTKGVLTTLQNLQSQAFRFVPAGPTDTYYIQSANDLYLNQDPATSYLSKYEAATNGALSQWVIEGADATGIRLKNVNINMYYAADGTNPGDWIFMDKAVDNPRGLYKLEAATIASIIYSENFESNFTYTSDITEVFKPSTKYGTWSGGYDLTTTGDVNVGVRYGWSSTNLSIFSTQPAVTISGIDVAGYTNLKLAYDFVNGNGGAAEVPNIEASIDGGITWTTLPTVASGAGYNKETKSVALPAATSTISLRINPSAVNDAVFDNFVISGVAITLGTNINQLSDNSIKVYPNPFTSEFKVDATNSEGPLQVSVFDVLGRKVATAKSSSNQLSMGSSLNSGVYVVKVEGANAKDSKSFKIIKK